MKKDPSHAAVDVAINGDRPTVQADAEQLQTVFLNLLLNAAQASGSASDVRVTIAATPAEARVQIIAIAAPASRPRCATRFSSRSSPPNTGAPASASPPPSAWSKAHHGSITFECPPSGGTNVTVTLPTDPSSGACPTPNSQLPND